MNFIKRGLSWSRLPGRRSDKEAKKWQKKRKKD